MTTLAVRPTVETLPRRTWLRRYAIAVASPPKPVAAMSRTASAVEPIAENPGNERSEERRVGKECRLRGAAHDRRTGGKVERGEDSCERRDESEHRRSA